MSARIPLVNYLSIEGAGHVIALECKSCQARFVDLARPACGSCGAKSFEQVQTARTGAVRTFTIVHRGAPGVAVPFVSIVVDLDGGGPTVRANLLDADPVPESVPRNLRVELDLIDAGTDSEGTTAVGFGFRPIESALIDRNNA